MLWTLLIAACGGSGSSEDVERSMREFQLAASLRDEGNMPSALEHLRIALDLDPENTRAHLLLGYIRLSREEFAAAETHLRRGIALAAADEPSHSLLAEARNMLGVVLVHQDKHNEAIELLRQAATDVYNTAPFYAWGNLGWAYEEQEKYDDALEALREAVRIQPRFCLGHYLMGKAHFAKEEFASADEALTLALEADERCEQHYQEAWRLRGETRARLGQRDQAVSDFERCVELGARTPTGRECQEFLSQP